MTAQLRNAWGYQGNNMNLPVRDVQAAVPFYESILGFRVVSQHDSPQRSAILGRDDIQIGLAENGGDPTQDGCAFEVTDVESLFAEFRANGLQKELSEFDVETHDNTSWKVFYVVAPDGLCYWFGERQGDAASGEGRASEG
jgi:lactoylglutathione lyase